MNDVTSPPSFEGAFHRAAERHRARLGFRCYRPPHPSVGGNTIPGRVRLRRRGEDGRLPHRSGEGGDLQPVYRSRPGVDGSKCIAAPNLAEAAISIDDVKGGKRLTLLHFTDSHAQLETHLDYLPGATPQFQMMGGFARLKTAIDEEKARCTGACFLLDGGDDFQGSGPAAWSRGEAILEPLKAIGLDVFTPGNWEPAYGPDRFKQTMADLNCAVVCYNLNDTKTGERLYPASIILERQGVRIAVIGVTDIGASKRQPPDEWRGMDTTRMEGLRDYVKDLRGREKPDLVVALTHTGLTIARNLAREIPQFDVVLSGHTHERTALPILEGKVIVVEPGAFGSWLGRLDLVLKPDGGCIAAHEFQLIPILESRYHEDPHVKKLVDASLTAHRARMARPAGRTDTVLNALRCSRNLGG